MLVSVLENDLVRLEPLRSEHVEPLLVAATEDRSTYGLAPVPRDRETMILYVETALNEARAGSSVPFAIVRKEQGQDAIVGSTRLMDLTWWRWPPGPISVADEPRRRGADGPDAAEIGAVWLAASAQRTEVNTAACFLMMQHAFETWKVHRLVLKTDERNKRSRAAIERLGGCFEGILRSHLPAADGIVRNTAMFSIISAEWPGVAARLKERLAREK